MGLKIFFIWYFTSWFVYWLFPGQCGNFPDSTFPRENECCAFMGCDWRTDLYFLVKTRIFLGQLGSVPKSSKTFQDRMPGAPGKVAVEGLTIGVSFSSSASTNGGGPALQALLDTKASLHSLCNIVKRNRELSEQKVWSAFPLLIISSRHKIMEVILESEWILKILIFHVKNSFPGKWVNKTFPWRDTVSCYSFYGKEEN